MVIIASKPSLLDRDDGRMIYDDMFQEPDLLQSLGVCIESGVLKQRADRPKGAHSTLSNTTGAVEEECCLLLRNI